MDIVFETGLSAAVKTHALTRVAYDFSDWLTFALGRY